jgi:peptidoglycan/LPS O-acetylase OafA/YrhL
VVAAAVVQAVEAAGVLGASVVVGVDAASGRSYHTNSGIALTVIGLVTAFALGYVATGLTRVRRWSRTPALLTQLFAGIVSIYLIQGHRYEWGGPGLALAVAGFVALLVPPSLRTLASGPRPADPAEPPARRPR